MTEIDLGELSRHGSPAIDDRPRWRARRAAPPWWGAAAAVLLLATVGTDTAPPPDWAARQFSVPGEILALTGDTLYAVHQVGYGRQRLTAYLLADGAPVWQVTRAAGRDYLPQGRVRHSWFTVEDGVPLHVTSLQRAQRRGSGRVDVPDGAFTTAFNPRTGHPRWTRDGLPAGLVAGGLLLLVDDRSPTPVVASRSKAAVHPATGEVAWRLRKTPGDVHHNGQVLANRTPDGRLTSYDLSDGSELAAARTGLAHPEGLRLLDDTVVLWQPGARPSVVAYDPDGLARRWASAAPIQRVSAGCRTVVCAHGPRGVVILDPDDGAELWSFDWPAQGRHLVRELAPPWPPGQLLLHLDEVRTGTPRSWVVAARTGEPVIELTGWHQQGGGDPDRLVRHPDSGGATWFGRLTADPPGVEVLGSLGPTFGCAATARHLACQAGARVEVWLVRR